jgi:hypothetical protein
MTSSTVHVDFASDVELESLKVEHRSAVQWIEVSKNEALCGLPCLSLSLFVAMMPAR